jgi:curved DNA-binding protein
MTIPAGSRGGQRLRLKGRGIPVPGEAAGDQILVLQVAVPPADTPEKKALYEEMARTMRFDPRIGLGG